MLLKENFVWLVSQLIKFDDPNIAYKQPLKLPGLRGGKRRIFRSTEYSGYYNYMMKATITEDMGELLNYGGSAIPITNYTVTHPDINATELGEKYKGGSYSCKITSLDALQKGTTNRVYVHCSCPDFRHTFQKELIDSGYTLPDSTLPPPTGKKALAPAICKHLYTILMRKYSLVILKEKAPSEQATTDVFQKEEKPEMFVQPPASVQATPQAPITPVLPVKGLRPKAQNVASLAAKLRDLDTFSEQSAITDPDQFLGSPYSEYFRDFSRIKTKEQYNRYKFRTRSFNGIWMIVYTNPAAWPGAKYTIVLPDNYKGKPIDFYKYLQASLLLRELIEDNTTELDSNIRDFIRELQYKNKRIPGATQYYILEQIEVDDSELSNIASLIENYCL